jgi:hypothetical protein
MVYRGRIKNGVVVFDDPAPLPEGARVDVTLHGDFWQSPSLEELAEQQGVSPIRNIESLFGSWPGETHDGFEDRIDEIRKTGMAEAG